MLLNTGDKAPDFTLPDAETNERSLSEFAGRKIVLWFFPKANTPGWITEGQGFRDEFQKFEKMDIQIIGASADSPAKQYNFSQKHEFPFPLLCDESHEMLESYGVWGMKKFMGKEYLGITRTTYIINEQGIIESVYPKVKVKTHAVDILADMA